jgi:starvation-inducible outer membrane lipoprotein
MGKDRNSPTINVLAGVGFVLLLAMAGYTACISIPQNVKKLRESRTQSTSLEPEQLPGNAGTAVDTHDLSA